MTAAAAVLILAAIFAQPAVGWWRGVTIGRTAVRSHRLSVRAGARTVRWQIALALAALALIGAS